MASKCNVDVTFVQIHEHGIKVEQSPLYVDVHIAQLVVDEKSLDPLTLFGLTPVLANQHIPSEST